MARTKTTVKPPPLRVNYKALYPWAPDELCSSLTSLEDWRDHVGEPGAYQGSAFAKRHDIYIVVRPCTPGELVCIDERSNNEEAFFFLYQTVFKRIGLRLPFSDFLTVYAPVFNALTNL